MLKVMEEITNLKILRLFRETKYLYSFKGARPHYISDIRQKIFKMKHAIIL